MRMAPDLVRGPAPGLADGAATGTRAWALVTVRYLRSAFGGAQLISGLLSPVLTESVHDHELFSRPPSYSWRSR